MSEVSEQHSINETENENGWTNKEAVLIVTRTISDVKNLHLDGIELKSRLGKDLDVDSLDAEEIMYELQERANVDITVDDQERLQRKCGGDITVCELVRFVELKMRVNLIPEELLRDEFSDDDDSLKEMCEYAQVESPDDLLLVDHCHFEGCDGVRVVQAMKNKYGIKTKIARLVSALLTEVLEDKLTPEQQVAFARKHRLIDSSCEDDDAIAAFKKFLSQVKQSEEDGLLIEVLFAEAGSTRGDLKEAIIRVYNTELDV